MIHVFIVGSKGIPAQYGGFETFVEKLTEGKLNKEIKYYVSCMNNDEKHFEYNGADCFNVRVPLPGAPGRILHMGIVLKKVEKWAKAYRQEHKNAGDMNSSERIIVYILGCRIGPLLIAHSRILHKLGVQIFCNPDGLEWKRDKWNALAKRFLRYCEKCLILNSDLIICDSVNIEQYIKDTYKAKEPRTTYIAYGADVKKSLCRTEDYEKWAKRYDIEAGMYYLIVGRFVPENNYETMITEFMKSKTDKDLVIITNVEKNKFFNNLLKKTGFDKDKRIKFVGTVYNQELLKRIREEAYGYLHGHEVGGTNPSLLEALASTRVNLLLNVGFNKEVGKNAALYWCKEKGSLAGVIEKADRLGEEELVKLDKSSRVRVENDYSWKFICEEYEKVFTANDKEGKY